MSQEYRNGRYLVCKRHDFWHENRNHYCLMCYDGKVESARANYRDEIALKVLDLLLRDPMKYAFITKLGTLHPEDLDSKALAQKAYEVADAMLEQKFTLKDKASERP